MYPSPEPAEEETLHLDCITLETLLFVHSNFKLRTLFGNPLGSEWQPERLGTVWVLGVKINKKVSTRSMHETEMDPAMIPMEHRVFLHSFLGCIWFWKTWFHFEFWTIEARWLQQPLPDRGLRSLSLWSSSTQIGVDAWSPSLKSENIEAVGTLGLGTLGLGTLGLGTLGLGHFLGFNTWGTLGLWGTWD